jgi:hypothetical protein
LSLVPSSCPTRPAPCKEEQGHPNAAVTGDCLLSITTYPQGDNGCFSEHGQAEHIGEGCPGAAAEEWIPNRAAKRPAALDGACLHQVAVDLIGKMACELLGIGAKEIRLRVKRLSANSPFLLA